LRFRISGPAKTLNKFRYGRRGDVYSILEFNALRDGNAFTYDEDHTAGGFYNVGTLTKAQNSAAILTYDHDKLGRQVKQTLTINGLTCTDKTLWLVP